MEFIKKIQGIEKEYSNNKIVRKNGTVLYAPGKIPRCKHYFYKGLTEDAIQHYIIDAYNNKFPDEYIEILKYTSGADLFNVKLNTDTFSFACVLLTIFGIPRASEIKDPDDEEPFDIRIADLERNKNISPKWLKCATYTNPKDLHTYYDIFIDTTDGKTYSCLKNDYKIVYQWDTLDSALCYMFETLEDCQTEYVFKSRKTYDK